MKDEKNLTFPPKQPGTKKGYTGGSCKTLENKGKSSFRASEARPGIQDFQAILDSGFRRNDRGGDFCKNLTGEILL
jgi:hypothetical protein